MFFKTFVKKNPHQKEKISNQKKQENSILVARFQVWMALDVPAVSWTTHDWHPAGQGKMFWPRRVSRNFPNILTSDISQLQGESRTGWTLGVEDLCNKSDTRKASKSQNWRDGSGQIVIFHQPGISWKLRGFPLLFTTIWGLNGRVRSLEFDQMDGFHLGNVEYIIYKIWIWQPKAQKRNMASRFIQPLWGVTTLPTWLVGCSGSLTPLETHMFAAENRPFDAPKGKDHLPTIHFQGRTVSFREGIIFHLFREVDPHDLKKKTETPTWQLCIGTPSLSLVSHATTRGDEDPGCEVHDV